MTEVATMQGVTEHTEGLAVRLVLSHGRLAVQAMNEGGFSSTSVDLVELLEWVKANRPELLGVDDAQIAALQSLCRRARAQLRKWSEWYGVEDHVARGQLALPPAGDVELSEDITEALEKKP